MTDFALAWNDDGGYADFLIAAGDIVTGGDLQTAVIVSLFTDAEAPPNYPAGGSDYRGWWGNSYSPTPWGSLLWTLARSGIADKPTLLKMAQDYCNTALQWLIDDGVAASILVTTSFLSPTIMRIRLLITEPTLGSAAPFQFAWAWNNQPAGN